MDNGSIAFFLIVWFAAFLLGLGLMFYARRIFKWSVDHFGGLYEWVKKKTGIDYIPILDELGILVIWWFRILGAGVAIMSVFALYLLITTYIL
jgi:hypothetical protein